MTGTGLRPGWGGCTMFMLPRTVRMPHEGIFRMRGTLECLTS
jgi:hypothetical protein